MEEITLEGLKNPMTAGIILFGLVWILKRALNLKGWATTIVALMLTGFVGWGIWTEHYKLLMFSLGLIVMFGGAVGIDRTKEGVKSLLGRTG